MSWGDPHYFVARRRSGLFTVTKFTDDTQPHRIVTVDLNKQRVLLDFHMKPTQATADKYLHLVRRFISDGEPLCAVYTIDESDHVFVNEFGWD